MTCTWKRDVTELNTYKNIAKPVLPVEMEASLPYLESSRILSSSILSNER